MTWRKCANICDTTVVYPATTHCSMFSVQSPKIKPWQNPLPVCRHPPWLCELHIKIITLWGVPGHTAQTALGRGQFHTATDGREWCSAQEPLHHWNRGRTGLDRLLNPGSLQPLQILQPCSITPQQGAEIPLFPLESPPLFLVPDHENARQTYQRHRTTSSALQ